MLSPHGCGVLYWPSFTVLTDMMSFLPPSSLCALMATARSGCAAATLRDVWFGLAIHCAPFRAQELQALHDARFTHDWMGLFKVTSYAILVVVIVAVASTLFFLCLCLSSALNIGVT